ncbi:hypothetical protein HGRIS_006592 [Hohenbuehelia grisea]|uniref:Extracellular membrane protein CFEM domain-containing protein n=1 Tax=Hohenbuehelia grisea TaxID=104357 RepID=A0ABR3J9G3_9AGAR
MRSFSVVAALFFLLASRALAFTLSVGKVDLAVADILAIPDSPVKQACAAQCTQADQALRACNDDASCLCGPNTVSPLQACEQCMFTELIRTNKPLPDFRAGSTPVLAGMHSRFVVLSTIF